MTKTIKNFILGSIIAVSPFLGFSTAHAAGIFKNHAYIVDTGGTLIRDGSEKCVRTGSWGDPAHFLVECGDAVEPPAEPAPVVKPPPPVRPQPPAIRAVLQTDAYFDFDKAILKPEGKAKLDEFVAKMQEYTQVDVLLVTGHADRIGTDAYNMRLSQRRADAVKSYMVSKGVASQRIETDAKGESEPVVECAHIKGPENRHNKALIECLAPNRRVVVEAKVQREAP
jgi:OOP family OmpA-OmpF porin